jgi:hypothetical protein
VLAGVQHGHHVGMGDPLGDARLALESLAENPVAGELRLHEFERNLLAVSRPREEDSSHPAHCDEGLDLPCADLLADDVV